MHIQGPLAGVRILDLSRILAGPSCTQLLGDLGADVIKIERPGAGDDTRAWGPPFLEDKDGNPTGESAYYVCANRNKRSVALDIATPQGARTVRALLAHCDVLVENFKVGGLKKYGLSYDDLAREFPRLVYCSITGFGQTGPNAEKPGYDLLAQGYGGIMSLTGPAAGEPTKVAVGIADVMTGMYAATAILAALRHSEKTGEGQSIDIALVDSQISWLINEGTNYLLSGKLPVRRGNQHPNIVPYQVFETSDGHVIVAVGNDSQYQRFCKLIEAPELCRDERFATNAARLENRATLIPMIARKLLLWSRDSLIDGLEENGIPGGPINTLKDVFDSDQVAARDMKISMPHPLAGNGTVDLIGNPIKLSKTPVTYRRPPPVCGADTKSVLDELLKQPAAGEPPASR
ncbi:CoA-transferase (plasmid) [Mesorhizobium loti NZP2037]|nr:CaiB/BaiF CoA-transferase family protein [Mesorhizobium loti]ANN62060.1 CoA-transferase [Mesorhizobium loti NZP2037]